MNQLDIIYEDEEIFIINKPSGLAVQGGEKISHSLDKDLEAQVGYKVYLVHRLDKDTAGLIIVAKSPFYANKWTKLISSKNIKKEYLAICCGSLTEKKGIISEDVIQHGQVKKAITHFFVEKQWNVNLDNQNFQFSLIRLVLETGRMHQIRIHLSKMNCPICADDQHGNFKINKLLKKHLKIKKLLLAAVKLILPNNQIIEIPMPSYMGELCNFEM